MRRVGLFVTACVATAVVALGFGGATPAGAEPGDFDGAYGTCGYQTTSVESQPSSWSASDTLIVQSSGRVLHVDVTAEDRVRVSRFTRNGKFDRSYGDRGFVQTALRNMYAPSPARSGYQGAGDRLYLVGTDPGGGHIEALDVNGHLDPAFGSGGHRTFGTSSQAFAATTQSDGRLVVAYWTGTSVQVVRLNLDGTNDPGFVISGENFFAGQVPIFMAAGPNDSLYVIVGSVNTDAQFERFDRDGARDIGFVADTAVPVPATSISEYRVSDIDVTADGSIVVAKRRIYPDPVGGSLSLLDAYVAKYASDGSLDPTFGGDGWIRVGPRGHAVAVDVAVEPDEGIVVTGMTTNPYGGEQFLVRRRPDGSTPPGWSDRRIGFVGTDRARTRGLTVTAGVFANVGITFDAATNYPYYHSMSSGVAQFRLDALRRGAGLLLQWNGDAWATRFGRDPGPECPFDTPYWPDDNARGITTVAGRGGYVADLFGGIHPFSIGLHHPRPAPAAGSPYWPGWDIVRGIAAEPDGTGGYVLDGFGGLHPFHTGASPQPPSTIGGPYWPGWNITRGVALMPDGSRGYVLDGFGGIHPFTTPGHLMPPSLTNTPYWPGWDIARGISILGDGTGGYIVDGFGGIHPFGVGTAAPPPLPGRNSQYVPGVDWVRGFTFIEPLAGASAATVRSTSSEDVTLAIRRRRTHAPVGPRSR